MNAALSNGTTCSQLSFTQCSLYFNDCMQDKINVACVDITCPNIASNNATNCAAKGCNYQNDTYQVVGPTGIVNLYEIVCYSGKSIRTPFRKCLIPSNRIQARLHAADIQSNVLYNCKLHVVVRRLRMHRFGHAHKQ